MKLVYVAGPFRSDSAWGIEMNIRVAELAGLNIARMDAVPVIPHTMYRFFTGALPDKFWLEATTDILLRCDAIFLCAGWEGSAGSCEEYKAATKNDIPAFESLHQLKEFLNG